MARTVSAIFDNHADAAAAVARLEAAGVPRAGVRVVPESPEAQAEGRDVGTSGGFLGALVSVLLPRDEHDAYAEAIRRGGVLVVADRVPPGLHDAALAALDDATALDLDAREASWRAEGWAAPGALAAASEVEAAGAGPSRGAADEAAIRSLTRDPLPGRRVRSYTEG